MTVNAQLGILGWGMQAAKGSLPTEWYRGKATEIALGVIEDHRQFPPEVSGTLLPTGAYKAGSFWGGGFTLLPRLQGDLGWILKGLMGDVTSTPGTKSSSAVHAAFSVAAATINTGFTALPSGRRVVFTVTSDVTGGPAAFAITGTLNGAAQTENLNIPNGVAGATTVSAKEYSTITSIVITGAASGQVEAGYYQTVSHVFKYASDHASIPWMGTRVFVPGSASLGEIGLDCKIASAMINIPQKGILSMRLGVLGREGSLEEGPSWTWQDVAEDYLSVPLSCESDGGITLPTFSGSELPFLNFQVNALNGLSSPDDEAIIGSYFPDDLLPLGRQASLGGVLKWNDPDFYQATLTNATNGTDWSPVEYETGATVVMKSPNIIPGSVIKYSLTAAVTRATWQANQAPALRGASMLVLPISGMGQEPVSGEYFTLTLVNEQYSYA